MVNESKTIIYADEDLRAAIGTLSQGTILKIGEKLRKRGTVAYSTFKNRIVYIKVADLGIEGVEGEFTLNNGRFKLKAIKDRKKEGLPSVGQVGLRVAQSIPGSDWSKLATDMNTKNSPFIGLGIQAEYNYLQKNFTFYLGYEYTKNTDSQLSISMHTLDFGVSYAIIYSDFYSWDILAGPVVSPGITIATENNQYHTDGAGYGHKVGTSLKLFRGWKWGITVGAYYRKQKITGHDKIQLPGPYYNPTSLDSLSELQTMISINRKINL
ncbi:MAG: hypothetical protein KAG61_08720 [Bacteriovoracaceae bacterium]|nr:hypothetical protein [Bacteriovoracaceae bacterium]